MSRSSGITLARAELFTFTPASLQCLISTLLSISSSLARAKIRIFKIDSPNTKKSVTEKCDRRTDLADSMSTNSNHQGTHLYYLRSSYQLNSVVTLNRTTLPKLKLRQGLLVYHPILRLPLPHSQRLHPPCLLQRFRQLHPILLPQELRSL